MVTKILLYPRSLSKPKGLKERDRYLKGQGKTMRRRKACSMMTTLATIRMHKVYILVVNIQRAKGAAG